MRSKASSYVIEGLRSGPAGADATSSTSTFSTAVPPVSSGLHPPRTLSTGADEAGGPPSKFYELRDNLTSPQPHGLFLETEYGVEGHRLVEYENSKGVFVDGSQIQSLRFFEHNPLEDQLWEEGVDTGSGDAGASGSEPPTR